MTTTSGPLNRLKIGSACEAAWDEMKEGERGRFCSACQKDVLDFERMTEPEIRGHLEASRGRLCARLSRRGGELAIAPTSPPVPAPPRKTLLRSAAWRRVSPLAATFVTACLGGSAGAGALPLAAGALSAASASAGGDVASAAPLPVPTPAAGGALRGRILDDQKTGLPGVLILLRSALDGRQRTTVSDSNGAYSFDGLPAGLYDVFGEIPEFEIEPRSGLALQAGERISVDLRGTFIEDGTTVGILVFEDKPLRQLFTESELVAAVRVGPTVVLGQKDGLTRVSTELVVESLLKGKARARVSYLHSEYRGAEASGGELASGLAPGTRAIVFLKASGEAGVPGSLPAFESVDYGGGVKLVTDRERAAYVERLADLAILERGAQAHGELEPSDLMEWMVASAEDRQTRGEAVKEIDQALAALAERAEAAGTTSAVAGRDLLAMVEGFRAGGGKTSEEPAPEVLGAVLTGRQRQRLTTALRATGTLESSDIALFHLVRGWDRREALVWLARRLRSYEPKPEAPESSESRHERDELEWLGDLARDLENGEIDSLLEAAEEREIEIGDPWPYDESAAEAAAAALRRQERAALHRETRRRFADALLAAPASPTPGAAEPR